MQETWVGKIPWRRGRLTHSNILALRIPWSVYSRGSQEADKSEQTWLNNTDFHFMYHVIYSE